MRTFCTHGRLLAFPALSFLFAVQPAFGQHGGGGAGSSAGNASSSRSNVPAASTTGIGNAPTNSPSTLTRPVFLSGKVMFDDGTAPNGDIRIERVCGGSTRLEAHTDSKGRFSFQVGQEPAAFSDASETATTDPFGNSSGRSGNSGIGNPTTSSGRVTDPLWNCELRAVYPGFRSDLVDLSTRRSLDDPDVGTLVMHRLANVKGSTISLTSELAPKHAQKAYQNGLQSAQKGNLDEADKQFTRATSLYPKYAVAWFALGQVEERENKADLARASYMKASEADNKYVSPYDRLAFLCVREEKWQEAAGYSQHAIELNPVEFPSSFWYNAVASFELHKQSDAERSLTELLKLDSQHRFPEAENMLAQIAMEKGNYPQAAQHLRAYLALVPNAKNGDALKAALLKIDQASAQAKQQQPPQ